MTRAAGARWEGLPAPTGARGGGSGAANRFLWLALLILTLTPAVWPQAETPSGVDACLRRATELESAGKAAEAEALLGDALRAMPDSVPLHLALARLLEHAGRWDPALDQYGQILAGPDPANKPARDALARLFSRNEFPALVRRSVLRFCPLPFALDACRLTNEWRPDPSWLRRLAYTTGPVVPPSLRQGKPPSRVVMPAGGAIDVSRVGYGLLGLPDTDLLQVHWRIGYSAPAAGAPDRAARAGRILHLLLRSEAYFEEYLGLSRQAAANRPVRVYLSERGPVGAEQRGDDLFFYAAGADRSPMEWARQVCHEAGHLLLPGWGPFEGDDQWANGRAGEVLALQWLAEEAGTAADAPWPSAKARQALAAVLGSEAPLAEADLSALCRPPLEAWLAAEPADFTGPAGLERFTGFLLWVQAALGREALAAICQEAADNTPAAALHAFERLFTQALDSGPVDVFAGSLSLSRSRLQAPPVEGALRRGPVTLAPGDRAALRLYLPAGQWTLLPAAAPGTEAPEGLLLDHADLIVAAPGQWLPLTTPAPGWHWLEFANAGDQPRSLSGLILRAAPRVP